MSKYVSLRVLCWWQRAIPPIYERVRAFTYDQRW